MVTRFLALAALTLPLTAALGQARTAPPTLGDTLQWLHGASETESGGETTHIEFSSKAGHGCDVVIHELRDKAGPGFWIDESFSLADIDPKDITVENLGAGIGAKYGLHDFAVRFHTRNFAKTITHTSSEMSDSISHDDYILDTNEWFAPRFAKALARAATLCGARNSSF
jgi:hypothetical protein